MVDRRLRNQLSQDLRRLVVGRITNNEFDEVYDESYYSADDRGVAEIAEFGYGLYSYFLTYRMRGGYAVDKPTRRVAARCILFLRTNQEYDWPRWPYSSGLLRLATCFAGFGESIGCALAVVLFIMLMLVAAYPEVAFLWPLVVFWPFGIVGLASVLFSIWYSHRDGYKRLQQKSGQWRAWLLHGDYDVWPFRWRENYYIARRRNFLLGAGTAVANSA